MSIKYSVIIPVYNSEKTLHRCLDSLLNQKYEHMEIILINDGSKDSSGEICKEYSRKFRQICYFEQSNCGVSHARNEGIKRATGTYVLFVDSDDFVSKEYFYVLDKQIRERPSDLMIFSHYTILGGKIREKIHSNFFSNDKEKTIQKVSDLICNKGINAPWGKVYKRDIIEQYGVNFTEGVSIGEDRSFNIKYSLHINTINIIETPLYYVNLENVNSLSRKKHKNLEEQFEIVAKDINEAINRSTLLITYKNCFIKAVNFGEYRSVYTKAKNMHCNKIRWKERVKEIDNLCRNVNVLRLSYPKSRYCKILILPIRWRMWWIIDVIAWKLSR